MPFQSKLLLFNYRLCYDLLKQHYRLTTILRYATINPIMKLFEQLINLMRGNDDKYSQHQRRFFVRKGKEQFQIIKQRKFK